jgi:hypothetical protein
VGHRTQKLCLIVDLFHEPELIRIDHEAHSTPPHAPAQGRRSENHERDGSLPASPPLAATGPDTSAVRPDDLVKTLQRWRAQCGGLKADDAKRLKERERENARLKRIVADQLLVNQVLKEIAKGDF